MRGRPQRQTETAAGYADVQPSAFPDPRNAGSRSERVHACRIAIADNNPVVRAGLIDFISKDDRFDVIDAVHGGNALLSVCESSDPKIDVVIAAWALPDMSGADLLSTVKRRNIKTPVVIYTNDTNPKVLHKAAKLGASGFVLKSDDSMILLDTISLVSRGRLCLPYVDIATISDNPLNVLTVREHQLLVALAKGLTNEQIAARIGISRNTVKYHLKNIYDKLGVKNRAMAVALFVGVSDYEP